MTKFMIQLDNYIGSRDLKVKVSFIDLGHLYSHTTLHSEGPHPRFYDMWMLFILKLLMILSLNLCSISEGQWDIGAYVRAEEIHTICPEFFAVPFTYSIPDVL